MQLKIELNVLLSDVYIRKSKQIKLSDMIIIRQVIRLYFDKKERNCLTRLPPTFEFHPFAKKSSLCFYWYFGCRFAYYSNQLYDRKIVF